MSSSTFMQRVSASLCLSPCPGRPQHGSVAVQSNSWPSRLKMANACMGQSAPHTGSHAHLTAVDEKWEDDEFELSKLGEAVEDVPKLKITRINGIANEKPSEFPEIGYIPCTWLFPINNKHAPLYFNKTMGGFSAYNLLKWIKKEAR